MINLNNYYKLKYLKYKNKYISLQTQYAGAGAGPPPPPSPPPKPNPPPAKQGTSGVLSAINFSETDKIPKLKKTVTVDKSNIFYDRDPDYDPDKDPKATWFPFAKVKPPPPPAKQGTSSVLSAINFSETDKIPKLKKTVTVDKSNIFYDRDPDYDPDKDPKATWVPNFAKVKPTDTLATSKSPFF